MNQNAYIHLVKGSEATEITLDEVKDHLLYYCEQTAETGKQLGWDYTNAAFPYTFETTEEGAKEWFYLKGTDPLYRFIVFGVNKGNEQEPVTIQVALPPESTHGDKAKANEYCKFLGKRLKGELHLFNGRIMYFNPRK